MNAAACQNNLIKFMISLHTKYIFVECVYGFNDAKDLLKKLVILFFNF